MTPIESLKLALSEIRHPQAEAGAEEAVTYYLNIREVPLRSRNAYGFLRHQMMIWAQKNGLSAAFVDALVHTIVDCFDDDMIHLVEGKSILEFVEGVTLADLRSLEDSE